ncbi:hypothetical protein PCG10_003742 [Penicillium crustosum]|uniref:FAD-binding PCMH-type domain-containing protein n=1 Tax=Penicillium crustosum TaxID=36656 RepID=A0A9P5L422_PENCR|nr:hypothetical protein PCG10_003742 [Penicillium crustosum]
MPQDPCWPEDSQWARFNKTVDGNLIATIPIASVCHIDSFTPYDQSKCAQLQSNWGFPETHYESSSSIMAARFTNLSCNPFASKTSPCTIGNYVQYAVNATDASHVQKAIHFAARHNIRLVIRNTGHDLLGKSTGAGGLAIWMHYMKDISIVDYVSSHYSGKAMKMGAGVQSFEASEAAYKAGLVVVGGNCPTVGLAGGYSQGGGHGQLVSHVGLAADQVLEWEVVLADGKIVTASPTNYPDLYWALSGGGGGTYGVVVSMTSKAYPELPTVSAHYVDDFPTYHDAYQTTNPPSNITDQLGGGRLIPRSVVEENLADLTTVFRNIVERNAGFLISGVMVNSSRVAYPDNSVNPAWRDALMNIVIAAPFDYTEWESNIDTQQLITDVLMPTLEELTPGSGAYLNEADPNQKNWKHTFYGDNYHNLLAIKRKYDPDYRFYAFKAVGSDAWSVTDNGRLCKSQDY